MKKFAFIIHALSVADVARKYSFARYLPAPAVEAILRFVPASTVSQITGIESITGACTEGWFVGCPLTTNQLKNGDPKKSVAKIIAAGRIAQDLGADIVGLGAFTAIAGDAGYSVAEALDIGVTTGNSYTVATALEGALTAAQMVGRDPSDCVAAVLGATGSIGKIAAKMLGPKVKSMVINARSEDALAAVAREMSEAGITVETSTDTGRALADADIVVAVTSAVEAVVEPEMLKVGAVVCDVARPRDVSRRVAERRPDVLVIEGGAVSVPGNVDFHFNFGFPPGLAYACMAETMILALEGMCGDYSLGRDIKFEQVEQIQALARKHGFGLAGFRSFERKIADEDIQRVRQAIEKAG